MCITEWQINSISEIILSYSALEIRKAEVFEIVNMFKDKYIDDFKCHLWVYTCIKENPFYGEFKFCIINDIDFQSVY